MRRSAYQGDPGRNSSNAAGTAGSDWSPFRVRPGKGKPRVGVEPRPKRTRSRRGAEAAGPSSPRLRHSKGNTVIELTPQKSEAGTQQSRRLQSPDQEIRNRGSAGVSSPGAGQGGPRHSLRCEIERDRYRFGRVARGLEGRGCGKRRRTTRPRFWSAAAAASGVLNVMCCTDAPALEGPWIHRCDGASAPSKSRDPEPPEARSGSQCMSAPAISPRPSSDR